MLLSIYARDKLYRLGICAACHVAGTSKHNAIWMGASGSKCCGIDTGIAIAFLLLVARITSRQFEIFAMRCGGPAVICTTFYLETTLIGLQDRDLQVSDISVRYRSKT